MHKEWVGLLKSDFLACPTRMGWLSQPCIGYFEIHDNLFHVGVCHVLDLKFFSKFEK
jgi:hypothetical protein